MRKASTSFNGSTSGALGRPSPGGEPTAPPPNTLLIRLIRQPTLSQKGPRGGRQAPGEAHVNPCTHAAVPPTHTAQGHNLLCNQLWRRGLETQGGAFSALRERPQPSELSDASGSLRTHRQSFAAASPNRAPPAFQPDPHSLCDPSLPQRGPTWPGLPPSSPLPTPMLTMRQRPTGCGCVPESTSPDPCQWPI